MAGTPRERPPEIAEGVYRLGTRWVNFYLVAEEAEFTLIDAGYPGYWKYLSAATAALGAGPEAIRAVIVTHHHADHADSAERLRSTAGSRVLVGEGDAWIVAGKYHRTRARASTDSRHSGRAGSASSRTAPSPVARSTDRSSASRGSQGMRRLTCPGGRASSTRPAIPRATTRLPSPSAASCYRATRWRRSTTSPGSTGSDCTA